MIPTTKSVASFLSEVTPAWKKDDAEALTLLMEKISGQKPVMWGESIVGFGQYHYKYKSGTSGDWFYTGFSPRKQNTTIYITSGFEEINVDYEALGKHKKSVGCLYIKKLEDIDVSLLEEVISKSIEIVKDRYADYN